MANVKAGVIAAVATVVVLIVELLLFPVALSFMTNLNSSPFISAQDQSILANVPTLMIVIVLFTALGGMIGSIYLAVKG
jgi:hypothetical protein